MPCALRRSRITLGTHWRLRERPVGDGRRARRNRRDGRKCIGAHPTQLDESADIGVGGRFLEAEQPVRVTAHAAVAMIFWCGGERSVGRVHPEDAARWNPPGTAVRRWRRHRSFERRDVDTRGIEEGDRDRRREWMKRVGQPAGEVEPWRRGRTGTHHGAIMHDEREWTA